MGVGPRFGGSSHVCYDSGPQVEKDMQKKIDAVRAELEAARRVNPDPTNWELLDDTTCGPCTVVKVRYPNCTNREGVKIMVYRATLSQLVRQKSLDPHFGDKEGYIYPVARFEPTAIGWNNALEFARTAARQQYPNIGRHRDRDEDK